MESLEGWRPTTSSCSIIRFMARAIRFAWPRTNDTAKSASDAARQRVIAVRCCRGRVLLDARRVQIGPFTQAGGDGAVAESGKRRFAWATQGRNAQGPWWQRFGDPQLDALMQRRSPRTQPWRRLRGSAGRALDNAAKAGLYHRGNLRPESRTRDYASVRSARQLQRLTIRTTCLSLARV